jgi:hypothetical protein
MKLFSLFCLVATAPLTVRGVPQYDEAGNTIGGDTKQEKDDRHLRQVHSPVIKRDEKRKLGLRVLAVAPQGAHGVVVITDEKRKLGLRFFAAAQIVIKDEKLGSPPPKKESRLRRRLLVSSIDELAAEEACAHKGEGQLDCIFNELVTGDLRFAAAGAY